MQLHDLQDQFARAIIGNKPDVVAAHICAGGISASDRLSVYHHNVIGNIVDALEGTFSVTQKLLGEEFFRSMARQFVPGHMPAIANLNVYGSDFPAFIAGFTPVAMIPYLADVARFEWLWNEAYLAADDKALIAQDIAGIAPQDYPALRFRLRESVRLLASDYPVDAIWRWCEDGGVAEAPDMSSGGVFIMLSRPELAVQVARLEHAEYIMLMELYAGNTFESAASSALQEDAGFDVSAFFSRHFAARTFQAFITS